MIELFKQLINALIAFFKYREVANTTESEIIKHDKKNEDKINESINEKQKEVDEAIKNKDIDKINVIINRSIILFIILSLTGCYPTYVPLYVPETQKVIYMEHENCAGYWVPEETMSKLLTYKINWEAYLLSKQK